VLHTKGFGPLVFAEFLPQSGVVQIEWSKPSGTQRGGPNREGRNQGRSGGSSNRRAGITGVHNPPNHRPPPAPPPRHPCAGVWSWVLVEGWRQAVQRRLFGMLGGTEGVGGQVRLPGRPRSLSSRDRALWLMSRPPPATHPTRGRFFPHNTPRSQRRNRVPRHPRL
jgi:hypothetical protein